MGAVDCLATSLTFQGATERVPGVLCLCADSELAGTVRRSLARLCEVVTAESADEALALMGTNSFAAVILAADPDSLTMEIVCRRLAETSPAATLLVLGDLESIGLDLPASVYIRFLPHPPAAGLLEQMIEDYLERYRLRLREETLKGQLEVLHSQVDALSHRTDADDLQSMASLLRLYHVVSGLNGLTTPQEVGELLVSTAAGMMKSRRVALLLPDPDRLNLVVAAAVGLADEVVERVRIPIGKPIAGEAFVRGHSILARSEKTSGWEARADEDLLPTLPFVCMTLVGPDCPLGVLTVSDPIQPDAYTEESLTGLHTITDAAATALANQIRGQERNDARDGVMMAMAKLAESRDPDTGAHLERVQNYCRVLAQELARTIKYRDIITPEFVSTLVWSSPLHDIGKVGVPDHILLKPGPLTAEEFEIMKGHARIGGETLRALIERGRRQDYLQMAMEIAYYHHEKHDGSGYPFGLAGEKIPLAARIMALADVYDALTTRRVYKPAMPHEQVVALIRDESGRHFDPDIVEAFERREQEFKKLATELADDRRQTTSSATVAPERSVSFAALMPGYLEKERPVF